MTKLSQSPERYRRGQVDRALWRWFSQQPSEPPKPFLTRIKRLLDLDRSSDPVLGHRRESVTYAFIDSDRTSTGIDIEYTPFNVFCLAIGLDLLDAGFIQFEVVFLLRHIRIQLEAEYQRALNYPPPARTFQLAGKPIGLPTFFEKNTEWEDARIFMLLNKLDVSERFSAVAPNHPLIAKPEFVYGITNLREHLHRRIGLSERRAFILEIANTAFQVSEYLPLVTPVSRGRPAKSNLKGRSRRP